MCLTQFLFSGRETRSTGLCRQILFWFRINTSVVLIALRAAETRDPLRSAPCLFHMRFYLEWTARRCVLVLDVASDESERTAERVNEFFIQRSDNTHRNRTRVKVHV
jgi:hypothetical protein